MEMSSQCCDPLVRGMMVRRGRVPEVRWNVRNDWLAKPPVLFNLSCQKNPVVLSSNTPLVRMPATELSGWMTSIRPRPGLAV